MGSTHLYTVQYTDTEEYNYAYEMWLRESGWEPEDLEVPTAAAPTVLKKPTKLSKAARDRIEEVIDLTAASTIAGKHNESMTEIARCAVIERAEKNHRKLENNNVKSAVLEVQYATLCQEAFVKHLKDKITLPTAMQHQRRKTIVEDLILLASIKIGDWVFATDHISPGVNSEGGYGFITAIHLREKIGDVEPTVGTVDIHWLIANRFERHVKVKRPTVVRIHVH